VTSAQLLVPGRELTLMPWFKVDDRFYSHPKVLATSLAARGLWVGAGAWSSDHLTGGVVPDHALVLLGGSPKLADELVAAGLWKRSKGAYRFHDWDRYQPDAIAEKDRKSSAGQVGNHRRWHEQRGIFDPDCPHCQEKQGSQNGSHVRSDSDRTTESQPNRPVPVPVPSIGSVVSQLSGRYAHVLDDDDFQKRVIGLTKTKTGRVLSAEGVHIVAAAILGRAGTVSDPAAYVIRAIQNEPDPVTRWLTDAPEGVPPLPAGDQHPFKPDTSGTCESCGLPESNRHHQESA
jgi:hypothetical protein